jgi:serine/threonine protein kinase/tetratricopeptide (TPR) repeat protein
MPLTLSEYEFLEAQSSQAVPVLPEERHAQAIASRLAEEMAAAWRQGKRPPAEVFLARHPELTETPDAALRLIYEEICLRQEAGEHLSPEEITRRFPQWQTEIRALLECHEVLQPPTVVPALPQLGEMLGDFRLLKELGRGALGRVFLAAQTGLADRLVVLKVTPRAGHEHLSLARLQHTHIVPLYAVQDYPARDLRLLCMPFLGGTTLGRLLEGMRGIPLARRTGQRLLDLLDRTHTPSPAQHPRRGPIRQSLARASYIEAICWIGASLADALHYAHERGLVHLDVKPSNVLLADDGQPMLLDFHLAREPLRPGNPAPEWLGGTPDYMSPEQRSALKAVRDGRPIEVEINGSSDIYTLGVVLYEALNGELPPRGQAPPRLDQLHPQISAGLADIVHKCLAANPADRYADTAALAADLRRHLGNLPLRGVPNRSLRERWQKWRRRRPHALAIVALLVIAVAAVAVVGGLGLRFHARQYNFAVAALQDGREELRQDRPEDAVRTFSRGLEQARAMVGGHHLAEEIGAELQRARREIGAQNLHSVVERLRLLYDAPGISTKDLQELAQRCRELWEKRNVLVDAESPKLAPERERQIRSDFLDLALLWTDFHERQAADAERDTARRKAKLAGALGMARAAADAERRAAQHPPQTAWEHIALGRSYLHREEYPAAKANFLRALDLEPQGFWPNFYLGVCAYRQERYQDALVAFHACVTLAPQTPECFYNRALAHTALANPSEAFRDYDRALRLDPKLAAAALNRGVLHCKLGHLDPATLDLQLALKLGADAAIAWYNLALVHLARNDRPAALTSLTTALKHNPRHPEALELQKKLLAKGD